MSAPDTHSARLTRLLGGLGAGSCTAFVLACSAGAAPLSPSSPLYSPGGSPIVNENPEVSVVYAGKMVENFNLPQHGEDLSSSVRKATLEWEEGVAGPVDQIEYTGVYGAESIHWKLSKFTGSTEENATDPSGKPFGCNGPFSSTTTDGGEQGVFVPLESPGHPAGGGDPATNPDYSVRPPGGLPVSHLLSLGPPSSNCETNYFTGTGTTTWGFPVAFSPSEAVKNEWGDTVNPTVYFPPGGSHTQALNFTYSCEPPECGPGSDSKGQKYGSVSIKVESSITFSSPGLGEGAPVVKKSAGGPGGSPPPLSCTSTKKTCQDKLPDRLRAVQDLKETLTPMTVECGITLVGVGTLIAGVAAPETGVGIVLGAVGPVGAEIIALSAPVCGSMLKRVYDDVKIIEDPPVGNIHKLARPVKHTRPAAKLPSCSHATRKAKTVCEKVRSAALRYAAAERSAESINTALLSTVDRIGAADKAHNQGAVKLQMAQATRLRAALGAAAAEQRRAGAAIAKAIRRAGLTVSLTEAQDQAGIAKAFSGLSKLGVSGAQAQELAGVTLTPAQTDVLAVLKG